MTSKFTPGPWNYSKEPCAIRYAINDSKDRHIAMVSCYETKPGDREENEANADLISLAPEMFDALELVEKVIHLSESSGESDEGWVEWLQAQSEAETAVLNVLKMIRKNPL